MSALIFSEWPGAWERHIIRKARHSHFFGDNKSPSLEQLAQAQQRDQLELAQFNQHIGELALECTSLGEQSSPSLITTIKNKIDHCYDTACGLGAELDDQKEALAVLNDLITTAMRRALRDTDETDRLHLIKQESQRMQHLARLEYPIVCDLLRAIPPIPAMEIPAALLSETDEAYTIALEVLDQDQRNHLAEGIEAIAARIKDQRILFRIDRKLVILNKINHRIARSLNASSQKSVRTRAMENSAVENSAVENNADNSTVAKAATQKSTAIDDAKPDLAKPETAEHETG